MRPLHGGHEAPPEGTYDRVRERCDREGALLVSDEIYSGFRYAPGRAQEYFGIEPDLSCFAKGISNGYPLSALVGREEVVRTMEREDFFFSMTYAGEADPTLIESLFMQETHRRGVFHSGHQFCYSNSAAGIEEALAVYDEAMAVLASAIRDEDIEKRLEGPPMGANVTDWSS
jgi:4-aminobutyrate aminotransferase-like enzyme